MVEKVGWIGLGQIGSLMAQRVLAAGYELTALVRREGFDDITAAGGQLTQDRDGFASDCDVVCVSLFSDDQVQEVILGPNGILKNMKPGAVLASHTTGSPFIAEEIESSAPDGVLTVDATFSGAADNVVLGELTLMIGGSGQAIKKARPIFECYANNIFHVGGTGAGQRLKLINNALFAANVRLATQALQIADEYKFDQSAVTEALLKSSGASEALRRLGMSLSDGRSMHDIIEGLRHYMDKDVSTVLSVAAEDQTDLGILKTVNKDFWTTEK